MTIGTAAAQQYCLGNGATTTFGFNFVWDNAAYIQVYYTAAGVQTLLAPSTYTLNVTPAIVGQQWGVGGTVTYPLIGSPIASGTSLLITRSLPYVQLTALSNQGNNFPVAIEQALDTLTMLVQQAVNRTGLYRGNWAAGVDYTVGDFITDGSAGSNSQNIYMCIAANTSAVWTTDLAAGDWNLAFNVAGLSPTYGVAPAYTLLGNNTAVPGTATFSNSPIVSGTFTAGGFTSASGNLSIGGTAAITGAATFAATLAVTGNLSVNGTKFTVAAASGNGSFDGTLAATGNFAVNTNKFTVDATTGNIVAAGTVQGTRLVSTIATGTAPIVVASTTPCTNLVPDLTIPNAFTGQQNTSTATLTDGASIAWNLNVAQVAKLTIAGNRTLAAPTNMVDGGCYVLRVTQAAGGSHTLAYNAAYKFPGGVAPVLSTAAGAIDIITFVSDGTFMYGSIQKAFA